MAAVRPFQSLRFTLIFVLSIASSHALQLGESEAQITARHGAPAVEDHGRHLAVYFWAGWSAQLEFKSGVVGQLTYRRNGYLTDAEIQSLLQANGGATRWQEATTLGTKVRRWVRNDGAVATSNALRPTGLLFQGSAAVAEALTPAESILSESFLKFDAQAGLPVSAPATSGAEPVVRSNAQPPLVRAKSELHVDDPVVARPTEAPPAPSLETAAPFETPVAAVPVPAVVERSAFPFALFSIAAGLVLLAGSIIYFFAKRRPARPVSAQPAAAPAPAPVLVPTASADAPELDSLRGDQIELLLGEIFRRQGYTVELSAGLGADGASDLLLRRDGESIPVQSKEWKTARITERELREFYGVMASTAAPRGVFVTTGSFTSDARNFAEAKHIELLDRRGLEQAIAAVRRPDENFFDVPSWIGDFTNYARIFDPECPCCGQAMVIRHHRMDGTAAWGCTTYPRCPGKRETRRDLLPIAAAA